MSEAVSINVCVVFTSDKWGSKRVCPHSFFCLSVSKITQKRMHRFGWNVACRQMSGHGRTDWLLSPIRIIVRMPEPDCFLWYRMRCNTEFYYVGKISRTGIGRPSRCMVLKWYYSPRAVGNFVGGICAPPSALLVYVCKWKYYFIWYSHWLLVYDFLNK